MRYLLNAIYLIVLVIALPWLFWRYLALGKNRRGWLHKLFGFVPIRRSESRCVWFHAVSVGEVNLLSPLIREVRSRCPELEIVVSTTTETGFDLASQKYGSLSVFFFPMDFSWAIRNAISRIRPDLIVLAELEVWPNFVKVVSGMSNRWKNKDRQQIPIVIANGRMSPKSYDGYHMFKWLLGSTFPRLSLVLAQTGEYADRFRSLGCQRVVVTGSVKFDGIETDRDNDRTLALAKLAGVRSDYRIFLAGSTQLEEDLLAAQTQLNLCEDFKDLRLILAPRHPERCKILVQRIREIGLKARLRSQLNSPTSTWESDEVLIIDVIGELGSWWGVADIAYVGGSMGSRGGQNMIEPAAFGVPVCFGPNTVNFKEVVEQLMANSAASVVQDGSELEQFVRFVLEDSQSSQQLGARAQKTVLSHHGAAERSVDCMIELIQANSGRTARHAA